MSTPADGLSFIVVPMAGPSRGGTSLDVRILPTVDQTAADQALATTTAHITADVALSCIHADAALRCCCTPAAALLQGRAANATQVPLGLYRSLYRATPDAAANSPPRPADARVVETPLEFRYYDDPRLLRLSPARGSSKGESVTIFAQGWPSLSIVAAGAARCRFGTTPPVPATVLLTAATGAAKVVCTSPDLSAAGSTAGVGAVAVAVAPNGVDFASGPALLFHHAPQSMSHLLAALAVLLAALLLLRLYAALRRALVAKGYLLAAPAHWPEFIQGYVRNQGRYSSVAQHHDTHDSALDEPLPDESRSEPLPR